MLHSRWQPHGVCAYAPNAHLPRVWRPEGRREALHGKARVFRLNWFQRTRSGEAVVAGFAYAGWKAWMLGRPEVARDRLALIMGAVNEDTRRPAARA
jgi:hypothetical protein